jgi:hypothetical protein
MQANAAELMRLVFVRSSHLPLIWCAHDSFLIEDDIDRIEDTAAAMREVMRGVSRDLLGGFELRVDCDPIARHPDRFVDKREREAGMRHWNRLMTLIEEEEHGREIDGPGRHGSEDDADARGADGAGAAESADGREEKASAATTDENFRSHPA